jgi:Tat protein translocase TatB subunit
MALIGAVALIVIGPEKLPRVARTVGTLLGKAQRYVNDVKAEVNRSMELDELKKMKETVESAARDVESSVHPATPPTSRKQWAEATGDSSSVRAAGAGNLPRVQAPEEEVAPEAGRRAAVVQGPHRRAHPRAVRRRACGKVPSAEVQLKAILCSLAGATRRRLFPYVHISPRPGRRTGRHRAALRAAPGRAARPPDQGRDRHRRGGRRAGVLPRPERAVRPDGRAAGGTCPRAPR